MFKTSFRCLTFKIQSGHAAFCLCELIKLDSPDCALHWPFLSFLGKRFLSRTLPAEDKLIAHLPLPEFVYSMDSGRLAPAQYWTELSVHISDVYGCYDSTCPDYTYWMTCPSWEWRPLSVSFPEVSPHFYYNEAGLRTGYVALLQSFKAFEVILLWYLATQKYISCLVTIEQSVSSSCLWGAWTRGRHCWRKDVWGA